MTWVKSTAKVFYNPHRPGIRKIRPGTLVVANVDVDIAEYYRWMVLKRHGLRLQSTAFFPHITVVDGKVKNDIQHSNWNNHNKEVIEFEYNVDIVQHWKFWTLPVRSKSLDLIRNELGLKSDYDFHITFGRMQ